MHCDVAYKPRKIVIDFRNKNPADCGVFCFKSVCSGIGFGARLRYGREGRLAVPEVFCKTY